MQPFCLYSTVWAFGTVLYKRRVTPAECARKQRAQKCAVRERFGFRALRHFLYSRAQLLHDTADTKLTSLHPHR